MVKDKKREPRQRRVVAPPDFGTHHYIGRRPCGCIIAVVVDMPQYRKASAKDVAGFIKRGLEVTHVTHEKYLALGGVKWCKCPKAEVVNA